MNNRAEAHAVEPRHPGATLIELSGHLDRRAGAERSAPARRSAQILFFTGVRYERMDEPAPLREAL